MSIAEKMRLIRLESTACMPRLLFYLTGTIVVLSIKPGLDGRCRALYRRTNRLRILRIKTTLRFLLSASLYASLLCDIGRVTYFSPVPGALEAKNRLGKRLHAKS